MSEFPLINKMSATDIPGVLQIQEECRLSKWTAKGYRSEINNESSICLVARNDASLVGFLVAGFIESEATAELYNIGISAQYRRNGLGSRFIDSLRNAAKHKNIDMIFLEVRKSNETAIAFYERHGFEYVGTRRRFYSNPAEDARIMRLNISGRLHLS